ncbi:unnamed protein product [Phytomonas sp. Hart1]|nr:unnamed protein product [Phytomonas sp. Hart1]|eukprot:CCW68123.1 unnamed protein product [Phytomonas sp. isolate Hart1]
MSFRLSGRVLPRRRPAMFGSLLEPRRRLTRIYSSYYTADLFPNQLVPIQQCLPRGVTASTASKGPSAVAEVLPTPAPERMEETDAVSWDSAGQTDLVQVNLDHQRAQSGDSDVKLSVLRRPYVPLGQVAKLELQGDYLTEGNLHQEALEHYGVVAKAYQLAYPETHSKQVGILLKLAGAFRRTSRLESSEANLRRALNLLDRSEMPTLELIVEALLEMGLTKEAMNDREAGATYEEAMTVANLYHRFGESHRMLRLLPRLGRRFHLNFEEKFRYYSPFDYDRTFAILDQCMARAEQFYRRNEDHEGVIRALQLRKEMIDKKFFNMRDFAGRIHTMRGHWMRRASVLTNAPTPDELLRYSPTIHQVYRDFKYELNAPIGREKEVQQGVNRVVLDMGNPYRRRGAYARKMLRDSDYNFAKYIQNKEFDD